MNGAHNAHKGSVPLCSLVASHAGHEYYEIYRKNHANTDRLIPNQFLNNCDETAATDNNFGAQ